MRSPAQLALTGTESTREDVDVFPYREVGWVVVGACQPLCILDITEGVHDENILVEDTIFVARRTVKDTPLDHEASEGEITFVDDVVTRLVSSGPTLGLHVGRDAVFEDDGACVSRHQLPARDRPNVRFVRNSGDNAEPRRDENQHCTSQETKKRVLHTRLSSSQGTSVLACTILIISLNIKKRRLAASWKKLIKKFLLPFQNMIRADLFSGSLAVWNALGFAIHFARPPIPSRALRGEDRIPFELIQEYTANWENANFKRSARGAKRAARLGFERAFWAKRERIYQ